MMKVKVFLSYFFSIIFISVLFVGIYIYYPVTKPDQHNVHTVEVTTKVHDVETTKNTLGYIYFTATPKDIVTLNEIDHTSLFAIDVDTQDSIPVIGTGVVQSFAPVPPHSGALVYYDKTASSSDAIRVGGVDFKADRMNQFNTPSGWHESDLDVSPDGSTLAFSQMKISHEDPDAWLDINNWEVIIYSTSSDPIVLDQAIHPQWTHAGKDIFFMKQGGLYKYNITTKDTTLLYSYFYDLTTMNDFTISPDNNKLVITVPRLNLLQVLTLSEEVPQHITDTKELTTPEVGFFYPVFSPDSQSFAVYATQIGIEKASPLVQIFNANTIEIVTSIELGTYKSTDFQLQAWSGVLVNKNLYVR